MVRPSSQEDGVEDSINLELDRGAKERWSDGFKRLEAVASRGARGFLVDQLAGPLPEERKKVSEALSRARGGTARGLRWLFEEAARTEAVEEALKVSPGTLRDLLRRVQRPGQVAQRWNLAAPPILARPLIAVETDSAPDAVGDADAGPLGVRSPRQLHPLHPLHPPARRVVRLDAWVAQARQLAETTSGLRVIISVNGAPGSGRQWIAAKLQDEGLDAGVSRFTIDEQADADTASLRLVAETLPWGPEEVERLVASLPEAQRARVRNNLLEPWRRAPRAIPEELRRPARLLTLVEQALDGQPVPTKPAEVRRVELDLAIAQLRSRTQGRVDDLRALVLELGTYWVNTAGSLMPALRLEDVHRALTRRATGKSLPRGEISSERLFAALEGDRVAAEALLADLAVRAEAPKLTDALVEADVFARDAHSLRWSDEGRALVRLLLASNYEVEDAAIADMVWTQEDRRVLADVAVMHGQGVGEVDSSFDEHAGRARVGVYLAALEVALALGPERVVPGELLEVWPGALYGVALGAVPGFEFQPAERIVAEVSELFADVLPRLAEDAHAAVAERVGAGLREELAPFGSWESPPVRKVLLQLCPWQVATPDLRGLLRSAPAEAGAVVDVLLARARSGEADAFDVVALDRGFPQARRPSFEEATEWSEQVTPLSEHALPHFTAEALDRHLADPESQVGLEQLATWLNRWPATEVQTVLIELVISHELSELNLEALPEPFEHHRGGSTLYRVIAGTKRPRPSAALTLLEMLEMRSALRLVAQTLADPSVLKRWLDKCGELNTRGTGPFEVPLRLRHEALLALGRLEDLAPLRAAVQTGRLRIEGAEVGRDLSLWEVLYGSGRGAALRDLESGDAWGTLQRGLRSHEAMQHRIHVRAMEVADDTYLRQELWPHLRDDVWSWRRDLANALPAHWMAARPLEERAEFHNARWRALLDRADGPTLVQWLEMTEGSAQLPDPGFDHLARADFRERLWRAAGRDPGRRTRVLELLRRTTPRLVLEPFWRERVHHTLGSVPPGWLPPDERDASFARGRLDSTDLDSLDGLSLTLGAHRGWTPEASALVLPAIEALASRPASEANSVYFALDAILRYDDDGLGQLYAAGYRWLHGHGGHGEHPALHADLRARLAERAYALEWLTDTDVDEADRGPAIDRIGANRRVETADAESLWRFLAESTLDSSRIVDRLEELLAAKYARECLARAARVPSWGLGWSAAVARGFALDPEAWLDGLGAFDAWKHDASACRWTLDACVAALGPTHPSFADACRRLDEVALERGRG